MSFDPRDPYDAAALYDMWLNCSRCPATFDFEPGGDINLDYYHRIGQQARRDKWAVLPARSKGDELVFNVLCRPVRGVLAWLAAMAAWSLRPR